MKIFFGFILCLLLFAESVYGATRNFQLAWTYTGTQHSGFHVEYMPPGGSFALAPNGTITNRDARTFTHANVTANVGQTLSWRVRAFNSGQTSAYSNTATAVMPAQNMPPSVNAGTDFSVAIGVAANLNGTVTDDGLPKGTVTTTWSKISGPGTVTFGNSAAVDTTASFNAIGTYTLRLSATDSQLFSSDDVVATVTGTTQPKPPPAPSLGKTVLSPTSCRFTLAGTPPDQLGGWTVQYKYNAGINFGAPSNVGPSYFVQATLPNGTYDFWGSWTKSGQPTLQSLHRTGIICP